MVPHKVNSIGMKPLGQFRIGLSAGLVLCFVDGAARLGMRMESKKGAPTYMGAP